MSFSNLKSEGIVAIMLVIVFISLNYLFKGNVIEYVKWAIGASMDMTQWVTSAMLFFLVLYEI